MRVCPGFVGPGGFGDDQINNNQSISGGDGEERALVAWWPHSHGPTRIMMLQCCGAVLRCCSFFFFFFWSLLFFPARTLFHAARARSSILDPRVQPRSRALHRIVTAVIGLVRPGPVPVPRVGQESPFRLLGSLV